MYNQRLIDWEQFSSLSLEKRMEFFFDRSNNFCALFAQQFSRSFLDRLYLLTNKTRLIAKTKEGKHWLMRLLSHHRAMLYFIQPSTRTFLSFSAACEVLGMRCTDVRSVETSSEIKGETFEDTIRTFSSYFDLVIIRHPQPGYAEKAAFVLQSSRRPIPLINAGSSDDQHPTQALLDIFTLRKSFSNAGGLEGKTIMMVGDLKRGRTVRSLCYLLTLFQDVNIIFASPQSFRIKEDIKTFLKEKNVSFIESDDMVKHLKKIDAIYMTRIQDEYDEKKILPSGEMSPSGDEFQHFKLRAEHLKLLKPESVILHPLPRRDEIEKSIDNDPRAIYWRQVRNGMWTRSALISTLFNVDKKIIER